MRPWCIATLLLGLSVLDTPLIVASPASSSGEIVARDGGAHMHHNSHAQPLIHLNETEISMYHEPTPASYYTLDWEDDGHQSQHGGLMVLHGIVMCLAFFVSLPASIALRSVKHHTHGLAMLSFYGLAALGCASSAVYRKLTPNMYAGAAHGKQSYVILLVAVLLSILDVVSSVRRFINFVRGPTHTLKEFYAVVIKNEDRSGDKETLEYIGLISDEPQELETSEGKVDERDSVEMEEIHLDQPRTSKCAHSVHHHHHQRHFSTISDRTHVNVRSASGSETTLQERFSTPRTLLHRIGETAFTVVERSLVVAGFAQLLNGIVVYTGGCRENYLNGCLAHLIKGGIFWCYGLLTFARFLGSFAERGWAWNRAPSPKYESAEFVESFVICFYGVTNTWMERFGARPGDPYTTKQIQHISIAVMFWFAGLVGMGIESKRIRRCLASSTFGSKPSARNVPDETVTEPASYAASFNPFPALVIGVTGAAMAAHFQTYLFQVQIHDLWGKMLIAFSVLRCLTYFFLWLGPPKSILPSRPPTEALGSFFLTCGGLVFMFSTEEVTIAAMRRGRDDVMMFLNVAVAITCLAFCWTLAVVGFKGWLKFRIRSAVAYRSA